MKNTYQEKQSLISVWILILLGILLLQMVYENYDDLAHFYQKPGFWILLSVLALVFLIRLKTSIDEHGIHIHFIPFVWNKTIKWDQIESAYGRSYTLKDFGGWGYRISAQGIAYNTKGKHGLQLILKNGKRIMIGTQNPKEIYDVVVHYKPEINEK